MDFGNVLTVLTKHRQDTLIGLIIMAPLSYTCLYVSCESFVLLDFADRAIFAITADVISTFIIVFISAAIDQSYANSPLFGILSVGCSTTVFAALCCLVFNATWPIVIILYFSAVAVYSGQGYTYNRIEKKREKRTDDIGDDC